MSSPRDAMSVATITSYLPLLKPSNASMRSRWVRLECNTATACFACLRECATRSAFTFVLQKINTLSKFVRSKSAMSKSNFCSAATGYNACVTVSAGDRRTPISISVGSRNTHAARRSISGGNVAENSSVCRSLEIFSTMRRTSGRKPISSMRSTSSSTRIFTSFRFIVRCSSRSSSRPGVATRMSMPRLSASRCFP